jgi:hypothetical protein
MAAAGCQGPEPPPPQAAPSSFAFALVGDNPYPERRVAAFEALIDNVNAAGNIEWVLHLGDIKGGAEPLYSPETGRLVENFTRVEVFGDPSVHWVRVLVEPDRPGVFTFREELVESKLGEARRNEPRQGP